MGGGPKGLVAHSSGPQEPLQPALPRADGDPDGGPHRGGHQPAVEARVHPRGGDRQPGHCSGGILELIFCIGISLIIHLQGLIFVFFLFNYLGQIKINRGRDRQSRGRDRQPGHCSGVGGGGRGSGTRGVTIFCIGISLIPIQKNYKNFSSFKDYFLFNYLEQIKINP